MLRHTLTSFFDAKRLNVLASTFALATLTVAASAPASAMVVAASPLATVSRQYIHGLAGRGMDWTGHQVTAFAVESPAGVEMGFFDVVTPAGDHYGGTLDSVYMDRGNVYASGVITGSEDSLTALVGYGFAFKISDNRDRGRQAAPTRSTFKFDRTGPRDGYAEDPALRAWLDASPQFRFVSGQMIVVD